MVVHQSEIRSGDLKGLFHPEGLCCSSEFRKDLNLGNSYWFYNKYGTGSELKRVLLIQKTEDKADAKAEDVRKSYRSLGVTACSALQGMKVNAVEILVSDTLSGDAELLGIFENSLALCNYENSHKRPYQEKEKDADKKEAPVDEDDRAKRINKRIENISVTVEN